MKQQYRFGGAWGYRTNNPGNGLVQLGARWYWPEIGRFIQQDPIAHGMNWYAYVGSNPVVWMDPEGLYPKEWHKFQTYRAARRAGFRKGHALTIAEAAYEIDDAATLGKTPHFNWGGTTRREYGDMMWGHAGHHIREGNEPTALAMLGKGAHAIADDYAHGAFTPFGHVYANWVMGYGVDNYWDRPATAVAALDDMTAYLSRWASAYGSYLQPCN